MTPKSAKAKGRRLQNWVRDQILAIHPSLKANDIKPAIMGEAGEDLKLSSDAELVFPYSVECKSIDRAFKSLYDAYEQAKTNCNQREPLVFIKRNREKPLVVMDAEHFFELMELMR